MLIGLDKVEKAKQKLGERNADIIADILQLDQWDSRNKKGCCPFHDDSTPSFVYNPKAYKFYCFGCQKKFDIVDAYMYTGMTYMQAVQKLFEEAEMEVSFGELGVKTEHAYRYPHDEEDTGDKEAVYAYMEKRKISRETVDYAGVRQDEHGNCVFRFFDTNDVLCMVKYRPSHKIDKSKGEIKTWCQKDADTMPLLFNMNRINVNEPLLITEGEADTLAAIEAGYSNSVSVPLGAQNTHWIEKNWEWLEQFQKIIICSDNDEAGVKMRKEIIPRLGSWRTEYVEIPKTVTNTETGEVVAVKDLNEILYHCGKAAVLDLIYNAADPGVPSVVNISDVKDLDLDEMDGVTTGIRELDTELGKLFYGTLTIVSGLPGSGKSSFLSQMMCQSLEQDKPVWMFTREMPGWMEKSWLNHIMAGGNNINTYTNENGENYYRVQPDAKSAINAYYDNKWFLYRDDYSNKLDDLMISMEESVRKYGTKLLIVDNLMMIDLESNEDSNLLKQTECIERLIKFAMKFSVAVVLVAHPRKMQKGEDVGIYDISGSSNIINLAHRTLGLRRLEKDREGSTHDVCLTIIKDRMKGRAGKKVNMYYDPPTRRFYTNEGEYNYQYSWDTKPHKRLPYPHQDETEVYGECQIH